MVTDLFQYILTELYKMKDKDLLQGKRILLLQLSFSTRQILAIPENPHDLNQSLMQHLISKQHSTYNLKFPLSDLSSSAHNVSMHSHNNCHP